MIKWFHDPLHRKYVYNVVAALIPILIATGFLVPGVSDLVLVAVAAVLGLGSAGLASVNTPISDADSEPYMGSEEELGN